MGTKTALVVDDSKSARFALRKYLENHAYKVDTVDGAEEAYAFLRQNRPQVIFLDHVMPGIDGFQALEEIKNNVLIADIPVVMCSSNDSEQFRSDARTKGALDVLQKPPKPEHLARIVRELQDLIPATLAAPQAPTDVFDLAIEPPLAVIEPAAEPPAPTVAELSIPPAPPSKVANIREPDVAIEQAVMKALRGAMQPRAEAPPPPAPPVPAPVEISAAITAPLAPRAPEAAASPAQFNALREQVEARMKKLTQDLFVEIAEIKAGLSTLESRDESALRNSMQQVADASVASLHQRIEVLENAVQTRLSELGAQVEARLNEQAERIGLITQAARAAAAEEARTVSERTMMSAATRIADQLAQSVLKAQGAAPLQLKAD